MKPIDPLKLQRLVDGELDSTQIRQILTDAKAQPGQWQEIAIGFVENQAWSHAFRNQDTRHEVETSASAVQGSARLVADQSVVKTDSDRSPASYSTLVMAASLLLAVTIGYMVSQIQNRSLPGSGVAERVPADSGPLLANKSTANSRLDNRSANVQPQMTQADYHLEVPQEQMGELGTAGPIAPVPLFSVSNAEQLKQINQQRKTSAIPPEVLTQLAGSGYQMEQDVNYFSGRLGDGRSFVVPVRTIRFVPGQ